MSPNNILIYGAVCDPHLIRVANKLVAAGVDTYFLDPLEMTHSSLYLGSTSTISCRLDALSYPKLEPISLDIKTVLLWRRNKRRVPIIWNESDQVDHYAIAEIDNFLDGLVNHYNIPEFSSTLNRLKHEHKIYQLGIAAAVGLNIPNTIVSNDKEKVASFIEEQNNCIVKTLKHPVWTPPLSNPAKRATILVNPLTKEEVEQASQESFSKFPLIVQQEIHKEFELRIVAIKDQCIAYKIDSQKVAASKFDWRRASRELEYSPIEIPESLSVKLIHYLNKATIGYGIFDFVLSTTGEYVFLECNSDGQWAFLEENEQNCTISTLFAQKLIEQLHTRQDHLETSL